MKKLPAETPVYLFLGFLESGKTKFIQETFEDERFDFDGKNTLLLVAEEGEEEYDESRFKIGGVTIAYVKSEEELTQEKLTALQLESEAERVVVEYNGTWLLERFFEAMPEGWMINQMMTFFDARTALNYNTNMRQLVFDKIQNTQMVVFNRFEDKLDKMELHKLVRGITRQADIVYEKADGTAIYDDIVDPLPFDLDADLVEIEDRDYAFFYRDLVENTGAYIGKKVKFKGLCATSAKLPKNNVVVGRHIMFCCVDDIEYNGLACVLPSEMDLRTRDWVEVVGTIEFQKHFIYKGKGPVLVCEEIKKCLPPEQEVATFY